MRSDGTVDQIRRIQASHGNAGRVWSRPDNGLWERDWRYMRRYLKGLVVLASLFALLGATVPVASAGPASCEGRTNNTIAKLLGVSTWKASGSTRRSSRRSPTPRRHRAAGTDGYDESAVTWRNGWRLRVMT